LRLKGGCAAVVARDLANGRRAGAFKRAQGFRRDPSLGERKIWERLRNRQFDGLKFRRQTPVGPYTADFYCEQHRLVVEVDGGQHRMDVAVAADAERDRYLRANGYRVCRIPHLVAIQKTETALGMIRAVIGRRP
jgi:very-short-patch-repair endonuclease